MVEAGHMTLAQRKLRPKKTEIGSQGLGLRKADGKTAAPYTYKFWIQTLPI